MRIGIDLGGTKIEAIALDASGEVVARKRVSTPGAYQPAIEAIRDLAAGAQQVCGGGVSIGIGMPGSISPKSGLVRNANSTWLNGMPFGQDIEAALGQPVRLANDANCFALSEAVDGAGAGAETVFGIIVGTGCGGGVVVGGRPVSGAHGVGGEWGHVPLPWATAEETPGPPCWCGQRGCLETRISGTGMQEDFEAATGIAATGQEIVERMRTGDPAARTTIEHYASRLGRGIAMVVNLLDPDVIVLGGGMSNVTELYGLLPDIVRAHVFSDYWEAPIRPPKWGDSSGVRGAAWLWPLTPAEG